MIKIYDTLMMGYEMVQFWNVAKGNSKRKINKGN